MSIKLISWNVNGLRACATKGFFDFFNKESADIFCVGETKMHPEQADFSIEGYHQYWNSADKKGYSGTLVYTKKEPIKVTYGLGIDKHDHEGRIINLEFEKFFLVNVYTPNSKNELERLDYRMEWEDDFRAHLLNLNSEKPVIICGDLNVAHTEIDLKNPKNNRRNAGFTDEERQKMTELLEAGFTDTYRAINPDKEGIYSWWSYRFKAREKNIGWRIDYFLISDSIAPEIEDARIYTEVLGSDHCPVGLVLGLN